MMQYDDDIEESQVKSNFQNSTEPKQSKSEKDQEVIQKNVQ